LCCHARHDARPQFYGVKALAASATGGLGRLFAALRVMARATPLCAKALAADPVGGLDRYLLPCASLALGASTYTLRTL